MCNETRGRPKVLTYIAYRVSEAKRGLQLSVQNTEFTLVLLINYCIFSIQATVNLLLLYPVCFLKKKYLHNHLSCKLN